MARGGVDFRDALTKVFTFKLADGITAKDEGKAVAIVDPQTAGLGSDGAALLGKLIKVEDDGFGSVEISGCLYVPYDNTAPSIGSSVVVDGAGGVKTSISGGRGLVIDVDVARKLAVVVL